MLDKTDDISVAADNWLAQFEDALPERSMACLKACFMPTAIGATCWR